MNPWLWILVILAVISLIVVIVVTARLEKKEKERQESFISKSNPWKVLSKELDVVGLRKTTNISTDINEISKIDNGTLTFKDIYFSNPDGLNGIYYNYNDSTIVKNIVFDHCIIETNDMSKFVKCFTKNESNLVSFDGSTSVFLSASFDDMFNGYDKLKDVYIGSAPITISAKRMFKGCTSLKDKLINIIRSQLGFKCLIDATSMFEGVQLWPGSFDTYSNEWMSSIKYADRMFANDEKISYNTSIYRVAYSIESGKEMFKGYNLNLITFDYSNDRTNFYHAVDSANTITFTGNVRIHDEEQLDVCVDWSKVKKIDFEGLNSALNDDGRSIHPFIIDTSNLKVTFYGDLLIYDSESKQIQWNSKGGPSLIVKSETIGEEGCKFEAQYPMIFERDSEHAELYKQIGYSERIDEIKWCYVLGLEDKVEFNGVHFIDCNSDQFNPNIESISIIDCTFDKPIEWNKVFKDHKSLISVKLDFDSDIETMDEMFSGCSKLGRVDISSRFMSNVFSMNYVFSECNKLMNLSWSPSNGNYISMNGAFYNCSSIVNIPIENILINECHNMITNCANIKNISIRVGPATFINGLLDGNKTIDELHILGNDSIIRHCESFRSDYSLPNSLKTIDFGDTYFDSKIEYECSMFYNCDKIEKIRYLSKPSNGNPLFRIDGAYLKWYNGGDKSNVSNHVIKNIESNGDYIEIQFGVEIPPLNSNNQISPKDFYSKYLNDNHEDVKVYCEYIHGSDTESFDKINDNIKRITFIDCTFNKCKFKDLFSYSKLESVVFIDGNIMYCNLSEAFAHCSSLTKVIFESTGFTQNDENMQSMFEYDSLLEEVDGLKFPSPKTEANLNKLFYQCKNLSKINYIDFNRIGWNFSNMFGYCRKLWFDEDIEIEINDSNYEDLFEYTSIRSLTIRPADRFKLKSNSKIRNIAVSNRLQMIDFGDLIPEYGIKGSNLSSFNIDYENIPDLFDGDNDNPYSINGNVTNDRDPEHVLFAIEHTPLIVKWHTIHTISGDNFETNQLFKIRKIDEYSSDLDWNSMKTACDINKNKHGLPFNYNIEKSFAIVDSKSTSCGMFANGKMEYDDIVIICNHNITDYSFINLYSDYKFIDPYSFDKFISCGPIGPILIFEIYDHYNFQYLIDCRGFDSSNQPIYELQERILSDDKANYRNGNSKHLTEEEIKSVYSCITPEELDTTKTRLEVAKGILDEFYKNVDYCY